MVSQSPQATRFGHGFFGKSVTSMSDPDTSIPQKVAALAGALEAVCQYVGSEYKRPGRFYRNFLSYLNALGPNPDPWDGTPEEARERFLAIAAKFVEAVDTAERQLNATPIEELEPLSPYTDGVRWDVETRRTLKEIQRIISVWHNPWPDLDHLFSKHGILSKAKFEEKQSELFNSYLELRKRIFDLQCLPDEPTKPTIAITDNRKGDVQTVTTAKPQASNSVEHVETNKQELEEMERNTPVLDTGSIEWIASRKENQKKLGYPTSTLATYRLKSSGGRHLSPYFGVDKDGRRWRRQPDKTEKSIVYYFANDIKKCQPKASN